MRCSSPLLLVAVLAFGACTPSLAPDTSSGAASADDGGVDASLAGDDAGGFEEAADAAEPSWDTGTATVAEDAATPVTSADDAATPAFDGGPEGACPGPLGPGDLLIDELMIESVAGAGDDGEWLEVANTADCVVNLRGLRGECPVAAKVHTFDVTEDVWIPAGGTFLVADSQDPAVNHDLPGVVLAWSDHSGDVLRNKGGTVTLLAGDVIVDSLTWPSLKLVVGASVELPDDCPGGDADDFTVWQTATTSWFPGFYGTPNAPNTDVQCP
jgi:hypothetical protein